MAVSKDRKFPFGFSLTTHKTENLELGTDITTKEGLKFKERGCPTPHQLCPIVISTLTSLLLPYKLSDGWSKLSVNQQ
jgi:hypothetical protein